jgi:hypothetical protein
VDETSGNASSASSEFPHRRPSWSFGLWATCLWESLLHNPKTLLLWSCWLRELP